MRPVLIWLLSFISLYIAIFWISLLYIEEDEIKKVKKLKNYPGVSILVPVYNGGKTIRATVESLLALDYPKNKLEVIVINDESKDNTVEQVKLIKDPRLKLIHNKHQGIGKASAVNFGIKHAKFSIIGCVDDDVRVEPNALRLMVPDILDDETGAVISAFKVLNPTNALEKVQWFEYLVSGLMRRLLASLKALHVTPGAISLYKKKLVEDLGYFDTESITEDLEIAVRMQYHGYDVKSQLNAIAYTSVPSTLKGLHSQRIRWYRGWISTMIKYKDMILNRKYGFLGTFVIPISVAIPVVLILLTITLVYNLFKSMVSSFFAVSILGSEATKLVDTFTIKSFIYNLGPTAPASIAILIIGIITLVKAHEHLGEKWRYPLTTLAYFTIYQMFLATYWSIALFYELTGTRKKWRGRGHESQEIQEPAAVN